MYSKVNVLQINLSKETYCIIGITKQQDNLLKINMQLFKEKTQ